MGMSVFNLEGSICTEGWPQPHSTLRAMNHHAHFPAFPRPIDAAQSGGKVAHPHRLRKPVRWHSPTYDHNRVARRIINVNQPIKLEKEHFRSCPVMGGDVWGLHPPTNLLPQVKGISLLRSLPTRYIAPGTSGLPKTSEG